MRSAIASMPGQYRFSPDTLLKEIESLVDTGIGAVLLFGLPRKKDAMGSEAWASNGITQTAVREIKKHFPELLVMTDVCLCGFTDHGHCGVIPEGSSRLDQKATLEALSHMALSHAEAGADYVAPSAMARGQVGAIRAMLDKNGHEKTKIMSYSAKFASHFYGPFRDIADSAPRFGSRTYQLDYSDKEAALERVREDIAQGADIVMVKPALGYLDIVAGIKARFHFPLACYNVSGEYAMVKKGAEYKFWNEEKMVNEVISSIKRAGADLIITYHAKDIARWRRRSWA